MSDIDRARPRRAATALAGLLALGACAGIPAPERTACDPFTDRPVHEKENARAVAMDVLESRGLDVTRMTVVPDVRRRDDETLFFPFAGGDDELRGYDAWADVAQCPEGRVVVDLAPSCRVKQVYTVYGCAIDGVAGG